MVGSEQSKEAVIAILEMGEFFGVCVIVWCNPKAPQKTRCVGRLLTVADGTK